MSSKPRYTLIFLALTLITMIMSACTLPGTPSGSSLSPLQVLKNSATTMKGLTSSHIDLHANIQVSGSSLKIQQAPSASTITLNGSGDQSIPNKALHIDQTTTLGAVSVQTSEIIVGDRVYIQMGNQWYSIDKSAYDQSFGSYLFSGATLDPNSLLTVISDVQITDHGEENLNGQSLRHITANLDKKSMEQLLAANPQLQTSLNSHTDTLQNFHASVDVYIDENQFYLHRVELKGKTDLNPSSGETGSTNLDLTIDLSKYNQSVSITAPSNPTPVTDLSQIFAGLGKYKQ